MIDYKICILRTKVWLKPIYYGKSLTDEFLKEVDEWVKDSNLGYRTANDRWKLNSKSAVTMFLLKWQ